MKKCGQIVLITRIAIFVVLAVGILVVISIFPPSQVARKVNSELDRKSTIGNFSTLGESVNKDLKQRLSGYWQYLQPQELPKKPYRISDRIELKENGIFWQVRILTLWLPFGDSVSCTHIQTGYINPFKIAGTDSSRVLVDALVKGQAFALEADTCYIASLSATMRNQGQLMSMSSNVFAKEMKRSRDSLDVDGRTYGLYDPKVYSLADFFPRGSTEIIDKISLKECNRSISFADFVINELRQAFDSKHEGSNDTAAIRSIVSRYYDPLVVSELSKNFTTGMLKPLKGFITYTLVVDAKGKVIEVKKIRQK